MYVGTDYPTLAAIGEPNLTWILILGFIIAFFLAFGVGANDVANSFGTSVGSKVLTLRQACILATIFEILGAITMGYNVSKTIRNGMIHLEMYQDETHLLMLGFLAALIGSTIWNLAATVLGMPISGTHSIVGAIIGFSIVGKGFGSVQWMGLVKIVASWFVSPLLSGIVSLLLYLGIKAFIINADSPLKRGLIALPFFYSATVFVNVFSIIHEGPGFFSSFNWWISLLVALVVGVAVALGVWFIVVPRLKAKILTLLNVLGKGKNESTLTPPSEKTLDSAISLEMTYRNGHPTGTPDSPIKTPDSTTTTTASPQSPVTNGDSGGHVNAAYEKGPTNITNGTSVNGGAKAEWVIPLETNGAAGGKELSEGSVTTTIDKKSGEIDDDDDKPEVAQLFTFLQILTACFGSFAHGGNDVSNAIGPLVAVMLLFRDGTANGATPWYILLYGGIGISIGLWVWGRRVIKTMGNDLTKITPSTGFTIEIGAAITVLVASKIGLPISTTHCKVGSVVMVGKAQGSSQGVNWRLFGNIALTWGLTVPLTAGISALSMWLLTFTM